MPYTPTDVTAKYQRTPMLTFMTYQPIEWPKRLTGPGPLTGIMAKLARAAMIEIIGASRYRNRSRLEGALLDLKNSFNPSAAGCKSPQGPTRLGAGRCCMP